MGCQNILELSSEILDRIWSYCDTASLLNYSCCSSTCNNLLTYKKYEKMKINWSQLEEENISLSLDCLKFTKSISFVQGESDWKRVSINVYDIINNCLPSKLEAVTISCGLCLDGFLLPIFTKFESLKAISLSHYERCKYRGSLKLTLKCLSRLKYLEKLVLRNCVVSDKDVSDILYLTEVDLDSCNGLTGEFFRYITKLDKLRILRFRYNTDFDLEKIEIPMENVKGLTSLKCLDLSGAIISNHDMETNLFEMKSLRWLRLNCIELTSSLENICNLQLLTHLYLYGCSLLDQDVASILGLPLLYHLDIGNNEFTIDGMKHIGQMVSLQELDISDSHYITDDWISHLTTLTLLKKIDVGNCRQLTGLFLIHLTALPSLKMIGTEGLEYISDDIMYKMKVIKKDWEFEVNDNLFNGYNNIYSSVACS